MTRSLISVTNYWKLWW